MTSPKVRKLLLAILNFSEFVDDILIGNWIKITNAKPMTYEMFWLFASRPTKVSFCYPTLHKPIGQGNASYYVSNVS